jgi:hypothetical protein
MEVRAYKDTVGNPEEKRTLLKPRVRSEYNIIVTLRKIAWEDVDWIHLDKDVLVNTVMNFRVSQNADNFLSSSATVRSSRRIPFHVVSIRHYIKSKWFGLNLKYLPGIFLE